MPILLRNQSGEIAFNAFYPDDTPLATHVTDGITLWEDKGERTEDNTAIFAFCDGTVEAPFLLDPAQVKNAQESKESKEATARLALVKDSNQAEAIAEVVTPPVPALEETVKAGATVAAEIMKGTTDGKA